MGFFFYKIHEGEFTLQMYGELVREMRPRIPPLRAGRRGNGFSRFVHDNCMKGGRPDADMNRTFGVGSPAAAVQGRNR